MNPTSDRVVNSDSVSVMYISFVDYVNALLISLAFSKLGTLWCVGRRAWAKSIVAIQNVKPRLPT